MKERDNCFGALRFLFALIIVIAHLRVLSQLPELQCTKFLSNLVNRTAFFVISGFLIMVSYDHSRGIKHFFTKRIRRIFPAYILVIMGCAFLLVFMSEYTPLEYFCHPMWWKYVGANLCFLNFIQPCLPGVFTSDTFTVCSVNSSLWTQKVEIGFYLIVPFLAYLIHKSKRAWVWMLVLYTGSVLWSNGFIYLFDQTGNKIFLFLEHQLPGCMSYFTAGLFAYQYKQYFLRYKSWIVIPAILDIIAERHLGCSWLLPAANATVLLWCAYSLPALIKFEWLGNLSYGMYLYHCPILMVMMDLGIFEKWGTWPASIFFISVVLVVSGLSWHLLEKPVIDKGKISSANP